MGARRDEPDNLVSPPGGEEGEREMTQSDIDAYTFGWLHGPDPGRRFGLRRLCVRAVEEELKEVTPSAGLVPVSKPIEDRPAADATSAAGRENTP